MDLLKSGQQIALKDMKEKLLFQLVNGKVIEITSGTCWCKFDDGIEHLYARLTIEHYADLKAIDSNINSDGKCDSNGDSDIDSSCIDSSCGTMSVDDAPAKKEVVSTTSGKFFKKLIKVPLEELRNGPTTNEAFDLAMDYPREQVEERFRQLKLGTKRVEVQDFPTDEIAEEIIEVLKEYDPSYSWDFKSKGNLNKMHLIKLFLSATITAAGPNILLNSGFVENQIATFAQQ
eukprot:15365285-Ditylum_brightwellii.AAC.2